MDPDGETPQLTWSEPCGCPEHPTLETGWMTTAFPRITIISVDATKANGDERIQNVVLCRDAPGPILNSLAWTATATRYVLVLHPGEHIETVVVNDRETYIGGIQIITNRRTSQWFGALPRYSTVRRLAAPSGCFVADIATKSAREVEDDDESWIIRSLRIAFAPMAWLMTKQLDASAANPMKIVLYPEGLVLDQDVAFYRHRPTISALVFFISETRVTDVDVLCPMEYGRIVANGGLEFGFESGEHVLALEEDELILRVDVDCDEDCIQALRLETTLGRTQWFGVPKSTSPRRVFDVRNHGHGRICGFFGAGAMDEINHFGVLWHPTVG